MHQNKTGDAAEKLRGAAGFDAYYRELFGGRWDSLRASLLCEPVPVAYTAGGSTPYYLDRASIAAAAALPLSGATAVLDLCAAPGGKTLVLASRMDSSALLTANERSPARKQRLAATVAACLPPELSSRVRVTCSDGARWCMTQHDCYDRILLDAPCSSERHVLNDPKYLSQWSSARIKTVVMEQWSLLSSAFRLLVSGGCLLYSTCALSAAENDRMVQRLLARFPEASVEYAHAVIPSDAASIAPYFHGTLPEPEITDYGCRILPDVQNGAGPLYYSLIVKR